MADSTFLRGRVIPRPRLQNVGATDPRQSIPSASTHLPDRANGRRAFRPKLSSFFVLLFLLSTLIPVHFYFGPVVIHSYRLALLIAFIPCILIWISGRAGGIILADILLVCFVAWASLSLFVAHGVNSSIEPSGVLLVETVGAYLLARTTIRSASHFRAMARLLFMIVLILAPLALIETVTARSPILGLLRPFASVHPEALTDTRWGLDRVQSVFPHPIHYGVFCASALALTYYVVSYGSSNFVRLSRAGLVAVSVALSLSTGAFVAVIAQFWLIGWEYLTRNVRRRWLILGLICAAAYIGIDLLSNRTPFHVFVTYLTFNIGSAYNRIHIWNFGTAEVLRNPLFGIGFAEWQRGAWMSTSIDNFWLVIAIRHGLPAFGLFALAVVFTIFQIGRQRIRSPIVAAYRLGLLVTLGGLIIAGATVHYWNHIYALFMFLLGSGAWMLDKRQVETGPQVSRISRKHFTSPPDRMR